MIRSHTILVGLCLVFLASDAGSWISSHKWAARDVPVLMLLNVGGPWHDAAEQTLDEWNGTGSQFAFNSSLSSGPETPSCSAYEATTGRHVVVWRASLCGFAWPPGKLALTLMWADPSGTPVDSDVIFNSNLKWDLYSGPMRAEVWDFRRVAIHEFGHVLGLAHPDEHGQDVRAIMNSHYHYSDTRTIQADDLAGIISLYGSD